MKVLHIIDSLGRGGSETLLLDVCNSENSLFTNIVLASGGGVLEPEFIASTSKLYRHDRAYPIDLSLVKKIRQIVKTEQVDVVHSHQPVSTLHALLATAFSKVPVVHSFHGYTQDVKNKMLVKVILPFTQQNILVSNTMRTQISSKEWIKSLPNVTVVYNGVSLKRVDGNGGNIRDELGLGEETFLLGMVGNINSAKDQLTICKAMNDVVLVNPNIHCVLVGSIQDTKLYEECVETLHQSGIQQNVHFLGQRKDIGNILTSLDLFVFSTVNDTFGLALVEAMLRKVPCIVSDIEVMKEMSGDGRYAKLFPLKNHNVLSQEILKLIQNVEDRRLLSKKGYNWAIQNFSMNKHLASLNEVYRSIVKFH